MLLFLDSVGCSYDNFWCRVKAVTLKIDCGTPQGCYSKLAGFITPKCNNIAYVLLRGYGIRQYWTCVHDQYFYSIHKMKQQNIDGFVIDNNARCITLDLNALCTSLQTCRAIATLLDSFKIHWYPLTDCLYKHHMRGSATSYWEIGWQCRCSPNLHVPPPNHRFVEQNTQLHDDWLCRHFVGWLWFQKLILLFNGAIGASITRATYMTYNM